MPTDKVLNLPLSGDEIVEILLQRIEKRLRRDCFLHQAATYNGFSYDLSCTIKFKDMMLGKETLVWDKHEEGPPTDTVTVSTATEKFDTASLSPKKGEESPNAVRMEHDLPLPVETTEGRRKVIRKRNFAKDEQ